MKSAIAVIAAILLTGTAIAAAPISASSGHLRVATHGASIQAFTQVSAGYSFDCALTGKGNIACWGSNSDGQTDSPGGQFIQVSAGGRSFYERYPYACAIKIGGTVACWGQDVNQGSKPPSGRFTHISVALGASYACGIKVGGDIACWSIYTGVPVAPLPTGKFVQVSTGGDFQDPWGFGCGVRPNGTAQCWKESAFSPPPAPGPVPRAQFTQVSVGYNGKSTNGSFACGISRSQKLVCWGDTLAGMAPKGSFTQVSASHDAVCGLRPTGRLICWIQQWNGIKTMTLRGTFTQVDGATCGLKKGGALACWDAVTGEIYDTPTALKEISSGPALSTEFSYQGIACGVQYSGSLACWGYLWPSAMPRLIPGHFAQVTVGSNGGDDRAFTCGLTIKGKIKCWGRVASVPAPPGSYTQISANVMEPLACGLKVDGKIACWGDWVLGAIPRSPPGRFVQVSTGYLINGDIDVCGLNTAGKIRCWTLVKSRAAVPSGTFTEVSGNGCGLKKDGSIVCWANAAGNHRGPFSQMSAGVGFVCGLKRGGALTCWGKVGDPPSPTPNGTFTKVSAGLNFACGLSPAGGVQCWGAFAVKYPAGTPLGA
jgi:Regulator of chromosome condensation (RCC1) repeat